MNVQYKSNKNITPNEFIKILNNSTLGERRPTEDLKSIKGMIDNADIIITAKIDNEIIGVARSVTDFYYCCYLSDLAVDKKYQNKGIGKKLIQKTQKQLHNKCKIILLSAPDAIHYYPKIGFIKHDFAYHKKLLN